MTKRIGSPFVSAANAINASNQKRLYVSYESPEKDIVKMAYKKAILQATTRELK